MLIPFTLMDTEGRKWTVPAELISTRFPGHRFVAHKSLGLDDSLWMVSHFNTGGLVFCAETKDAAIEGARARLALNKLTDLNRAVAACYTQAAEIVTGGQVKRASSQRVMQAREEKKQAAAVARAAKTPPVLSIVPTMHQAAA